MARLLTIDCQYVMPQLAAAYLREEGGEVAFIETNTSRAVPTLLECLHHEGLSTAAVKYVVVTHVHLDHSGGAAALMAACPQATLLAHPKAVRHLVEPERLVSSARKVYGDEAFAALYGEIAPIPALRVRAMEDGEVAMLGGARLRFVHARGHANHHLVVHDEQEDVVFTGDAFGLVYPSLQRARRFAYPSTSPADFDGAAALSVVKQLVAMNPRAAALTHFGQYEDVAHIGSQLEVWLEFSSRLVEEGLRSGDEVGTLEQRFKRTLERQFEEAATQVGLVLTSADRKLIGFDMELNAQGLAVAVARLRKAAAVP